MVKSTATKPSTTPTKKTPVSVKTPNKLTPKPVEERPVKPVKEVAEAIDNQVMKEKKEKQTQKDLTNSLKPNGKKPSMKEPKTNIDTPVKKDEENVLFAWTPKHATKVQITGSFNNWQHKLDMKPVGDKHELSILLKPGKYSYKFIVDGEWCYDFTAPNEYDSDGNVNNIITV